MELLLELDGETTRLTLQANPDTYPPTISYLRAIGYTVTVSDAAEASSAVTVPRVPSEARTSATE